MVSRTPLGMRAGLRRSLTARAEGDKAVKHSMELQKVKSMALAAAATAGPLMAVQDALAAMERVEERIPKAAWPALSLFILSFPGVFSQIKRAPKASIKRATFEVPGPNATNGLGMDQIGQRILSYFLRYNYKIKERGQVVTFSGQYQSDSGQAAFITAFTALSMASLGLVLSTLFPDKGGNYWYLLTLTAPLAGAYVKKNSEREEDFRVKMVSNPGGLTTDIFVEGDIEEIERMQSELKLMQKGKVKVKGLFEADDSGVPEPTN
eukprot:CAMPEP_0170181176 /NCGR_PEP_ID=MMETSP0040_2-20121228/24184_1 /TAXON_ID=641309 /ORGANISM="Lotharella oceanica, Strain CCMP622" /LENGTH=264 /DNA_ID=CAMNT_0010426095 /DNA_START=22 /DNA_END=816 /DNA_ORIENTATION=-